MTLKYLAKKFNLSQNEIESKAAELLLLSELRRIETEIFSVTGKHGVKSLSQMDKRIASGNLSEEEIGDDFYRLDFLLEKKRDIEELLKSYKEKLNPWAVITNFKGLPRLNLGR